VGLAPPDRPLTDEIVSLRPFAERDVAAIEQALGDPEIQRWFGKPRGTAREFLERKRREWVEGTSASFAVCDEHEEARCVGQVFINVGEDHRGEVGYWLLPPARGAGRAVRAVTLVSQWAFPEAGFARLQLWTEPENVLSQRVAERAGFLREGVLRSYIERHDGTRADAVSYSLLPQDLAATDFANPS